MDFRAIAELIWFSFLGLSVFALVTGFTVRAFIAPVVREVMGRLGDRRSEDQARSDARLELLESRLFDLETEVRRVKAAEDFHRALAAPRARTDAGPDAGAERQADDPEHGAAERPGGTGPQG